MEKKKKKERKVWLYRPDMNRYIEIQKNQYKNS